MAKDVFVYARSKLRWSDGMDQIGAFVTTEDSLIEVLGSLVTVLSKEVRTSFGNDNLARMASCFDALTVMGIVYKPDVDNPFDQIRAQPKGVDRVSYPRETLNKRTGDCDDTAALVAALVGNLGLRSQLVDATDHVLLLIDSGLQERSAVGLGVPDSLYQIRDGVVWIPVETTAIDQGFAAAWSAGARVMNHEKVVCYDLNNAERRYPPIVPKEIAAALPPLDPAAFRSQLARDAETIEGWRASGAGERDDSEDSKAVEKGSIMVARIQSESGNIEAARTALDEVLRKNPKSAAALNDLGVLLARTGDTGAALERITAASRLAANDPGITLNLGLLEYAVGDSLRGKQAIARGLQLAGGNPAACRLFGWPVEGAVPSTSVTEFLRRGRAMVAGRSPQRAGLPAYLNMLYWRD
jgi:hypothetical protein